MLAAQKTIPAPSDKLSEPYHLHAYESLYERYLGPFRYGCEWSSNTRPKLLEIGIGPDGAARSMSLYQAFAAFVEYHALEYEDQRQKIQESPMLSPTQKKHLLSHLVVGDQANAESLANVTQQWGPFDLIVDDGGHMTWQQTFSFTKLFIDALAPGGVYIIEDLQTSFHSAWAGGRARQLSRSTTVAMLQDLLAGMHFHWWDSPKYEPSITKNVYGQEMHLANFKLYPDLLVWIQSIECHREICAIRKRSEALRKIPHSQM